jgi:hypothetical protein
MVVGPKEKGGSMNEKPLDYDEELTLLLEITRQLCQGFPFPSAPPIKDDISLTPTLTWVVESSDEHKSMKNAHS